MSSSTKNSAVQEEIEALTIHGLSRITSAKNKYARVIWLVLCISAAISFGIIAVNSFMKYYQNHIFNHRTVRQNNQLALPAITFCHTNFYHPFAFYHEDPPVFQHLPENCSFNNTKYFENTMNKKIFDFACRMFIGTFKSNTSTMNADLPQYFHFPAGFELTPTSKPCLTLNRNSTLVQHAAGEKYGLHMIMYNENYNLPYNFSKGEPLTDGRNGIHAMIHDPNQVVPMDDEIDIPPGYHTHISITKNILKKLPHPYPSNCTNDWSNRDSIYPGKNTQHMCYTSCAFIQVYKMCPGVLPEMKVFMKAPRFPIQANITNASFWQCLRNSWAQVDYQHCDCREHCNDETYTTIINRSPWPQSWQAPSFIELINNVEGKVNTSLSTTEIRERLIKISIYYQDFKEHLSEERPLYDLPDIVSNLGGQMGLFMGASLLSLVEIAALVASYLKRNLCKSNIRVELSPKQAK